MGPPGQPPVVEVKNLNSMAAWPEGDGRALCFHIATLKLKSFAFNSPIRLRRQAASNPAVNPDEGLVPVPQVT